MRTKLLHKVNGAIFVTFIFIAAAFAIIHFPFQEQRFQTVVEKISIVLWTLVERDHDPLANEIFENNTRAIKIRLLAMRKVPGILTISVHDSSGKFLLSDASYPASSSLSKSDQDAGAHEGIIRRVIWHGVDALQYVQEIKVVGERIGFINIYYSLADAKHEQRLSNLISGGLLFSILVIMLLLLNLILSRAIIRPVTFLRDAMKQMRPGEQGEQVIINSSDEIGDLAAAFNQMSADLARSYRQITDQNQELTKNQEEMTKIRLYFKNIIDSMPSVLVGVDKNGKVTQWNLKAEADTGIVASEAAGCMLIDVFPRLAGELDKVSQAIRDGKPIEEARVLGEVNGQVRYSDVTVYPLITDGVEGAVIRVDDITRRVRIEEMMVQSEKMISVGGLAAGMAHEINNPLAGIIQSLQVIQFRLEGDMPENIKIANECGITMDAILAYMERRGLMTMFELVRESGWRAARIVDNMLSFSRMSDSHFEPENICELLDRTVELASSDYDLKKKYDFRQIRIIREYDALAPKVTCECGMIQQVLLNLLRNAAQAMTGQTDMDEPPSIILRVFTKDRMMQIEVQDNGPGLTEATRKRIFEPFFTTKEVGDGTGLGLSVSYFIITESHKGTMHVESAPGQGTKFIIRLPIKRDTR